ncbi:hypothetical protein GCM10022238_14520 [Gordonia hankookensis]
MTDQPRNYDDLPVELDVVSSESFSEWGRCGSHEYIFRRKPMAMIDALERSDGPVVMLDTDTWFAKSAQHLIDRVGVGRSAMHMCEGGLTAYPNPSNESLLDVLQSRPFSDRSGRPIPVGPETQMWNSGVIGLSRSDVDVLRESVHYIDQIWSEYQLSHNVEQFALSYFMQTKTRLRAANDVVYHYFAVRAAFPTDDPLLQRRATSYADALTTADELHRLRPRLHGVERAKHAYKTLYRQTGRPWRNHVPSNAS